MIDLAARFYAALAIDVRTAAPRKIGGHLRTVGGFDADSFWRARPGASAVASS